MIKEVDVYPYEISRSDEKIIVLLKSRFKDDVGAYFVVEKPEEVPPFYKKFRLIITDEN